MLEDGRTLETAMAQSPAYRALEGRDRRLARAIAGAALRRLGGIDALIARMLARPLPDAARFARAALRAGAADLLLLRSPPHAAVNEAVAAARAGGAERFAGLINAVLRRLAERGASDLDALAPGADLPDWLFARWRAAYGEAEAAAIALALRVEAPLDITVKADPEGWAARLGATLLPTGSLRLREHGPLADLPGFAEGAWWVQDAAAALPARLLGEVAGLRVLDLCAAPGGKAMQLAAAGAELTALDVDDARLERLADNLARTGLAAEIVCADARDWSPPAPFDAILLDAPCTATGTLRRRPDAAWLRRPTDIPALVALQAELIAAATRMLKPGGVLVYAVCSLEPEEGPGAGAAAQAAGLRPAPLADAGESLCAFLAAEGALRTLPSLWPEFGGMDGFYAARYVRD